jgi:hypothetical protein
VHCALEEFGADVTFCSVAAVGITVPFTVGMLAFAFVVRTVEVGVCDGPASTLTLVDPLPTPAFSNWPVWKVKSVAVIVN